LYAWDNRAMGFSEEGGKRLKPVAKDYERVFRWLQNAVVSDCKESRQVWVCELSRGEARRAWLVWSAGRTALWPVPDDWHATDMQTLSGTHQALPPDVREVRVSASPVLLESSSWQQAKQF
jgi:hypothetical protein